MIVDFFARRQRHAMSAPRFVGILIPLFSSGGGEQQHADAAAALLPPMFAATYARFAPVFRQAPSPSRQQTRQPPQRACAAAY